MFIECVCGYKTENKKSFIGHRGGCKVYRKYKIDYEQQFEEKNKEKILQLYSDGYSISELDDIIKVKHFIKNYYTNDIMPSNRGLIDNILAKTDYIGKFYNKQMERKIKKTEKTNIERYGVRNIGMTEEHKKKMSITNEKKENPFSSEEFKILQYIKGLTARNSDEYMEYSRKVDMITKKNKKLLPKPERCYYSDIFITNDKKYDYNMFCFATLDHKISKVYGFNNGISVEEISDITNLCWAARFVNSIKRELTEEEFYETSEYSRMVESKDKINDLLKKKGLI